MKGFSIKKKLICAFAATSLIPIIMLSSFLIYEIKKSAIDSFVSSTTRELEQVDNGFVFFLDGVKTSMRALERDPLMRDVDASLPNYTSSSTSEHIMLDGAGAYAQSVHELFLQYEKSSNTYLEVYLGTKFGGYASSAPGAMSAGFDPRKRGWYTDAMSQNRMLITDAYLTVSTKTPVLSVVAPSPNNLGVLGIDVSLTVLTELIDNIHLGETGFAVLVQGDGTILANPKRPEVNFKKMDEIGIPAYAELNRLDEGFIELENDGQTFLATVYTSPKLGYKFIGIINKSEVMAESNTLTQLIFLISAVLIGLFMVLAFFLANSTTKPISHTASMLKDIAQGEGDLTMRLHAKNNDEIGELAHWFNLFMENLQDIIKQVTNNSNSVDSSATELSRISTELTEGAENTSTRANTVAAAAEEMSANLNNVAASMEQSTHNTSMVAASSEEMNATINEIAQNAESARSISSNAVDQSSQASARMNELNAAAAAIGKVTETITEISDQTNLLALNATIEAARAGDAGKGFAVVANEIKELAKQTAEATLNIKNQIEDVQSTTSLTMKEIDEVSSVIINVNEIVGAIATAVEEQSAATKEITNNITQVSSGIDEVNSNVSESSVVSQEITENITLVNTDAEEILQFSTEVSKSSDSLQEMATQLNAIVSRFKV